MPTISTAIPRKLAAQLLASLAESIQLASGPTGDVVACVADISISAADWISKARSPQHAHTWLAHWPHIKLAALKAGGSAPDCVEVRRRAMQALADTEDEQVVGVYYDIVRQTT